MEKSERDTDAETVRQRIAEILSSIERAPPQLVGRTHTGRLAAPPIPHHPA